MTRVAAVDCGTNTIRLLIADLDPVSGTEHELVREMQVVRLGQDVDRTGRLADEALERVFAAVDGYAATIGQSVGGRGPRLRHLRRPRRRQRRAVHHRDQGTSRRRPRRDHRRRGGAAHVRRGHPLARRGPCPGRSWSSTSAVAPPS